MRLRNKKTGKIVENAYIRESYDSYNKRTIIAVFVRDGNRPPERVSTGYETLAMLNAEWEDVPEPKEHWYVSADGDVRSKPERQFCDPVYMKIIGNYFESEEEAKRAVERLKAFKRLKDNGFRFKAWESYEKASGLSFPDRHIVNSYIAVFDFNKPCRKYEIEDKVKDDLDLLFLQGEEKNEH